MRYAFRCDYCGVFHKLQVLDDGTIEVENASGIAYQIEQDDTADVQLLNALPAAEDETRDPKLPDEPSRRV